ncbi:MAG: Uma2 family endonuclease [Gammaproteobacteria bacterium]
MLARLDHTTPEEYLFSEHDSPTKHEYVAGQIYAMVGVRDSHNLIAGNVYAHLRMNMRGGACRVFASLFASLHFSYRQSRWR